MRKQMKNQSGALLPFPEAMNAPIMPARRESKKIRCMGI